MSETTATKGPIPLTAPDGRIFAYACPRCLEVRGNISGGGRGDEGRAIRLEYSREDAARCCVCRSCGAELSHWGTQCEPCRKAESARLKDEQWRARERRPWGNEPLFSETLERYFFDPDDVRDAVRDHGGDWEALRLIGCDPVYASEIDGDDHFTDDLPEDSTLTDANGDIAEALDALNAVIREQRASDKPLSWLPGKYAVSQPTDMSVSRQGSDQGERGEER